LLLVSAAGEARAQAVAPEAALLASGAVQERFFYQCLADDLGAAFVEGDVTLAAGARYPLSIHCGIAPLDGRDGRRWLSAPRGAMLAELLARARQGERFPDLAITTPSQMSRLLRADAASTVLWEASLGLANLDPSLSAKAGASRAQCAFAMTAIGAASSRYQARDRT
jgi:glycosyltransferase XagB